MSFDWQKPVAWAGGLISGIGTAHFEYVLGNALWPALAESLPHFSGILSFVIGGAFALAVFFGGLALMVLPVLTCGYTYVGLYTALGGKDLAVRTMLRIGERE